MVMAEVFVSQEPKQKNDLRMYIVNSCTLTVKHQNILDNNEFVIKQNLYLRGNIDIKLQFSENFKTFNPLFY